MGVSISVTFLAGVPCEISFTIGCTFNVLRARPHTHILFHNHL